MTKKIYVEIYVDGFVFIPSHIYRRHLSPPVRKMYPIPSLPLIGENIIILSNKTFDVLICVRIHVHITEFNFWLKFKPQKKLIRFAWSNGQFAWSMKRKILKT